MKLMFYFQKIAPAIIRYFAEKLNFVFLLAQPPMSPVLRALASPKGLKGKNPRLQHQSEQFWVAQKPTKGSLGAEQEGIQNSIFRRIIELFRELFFENKA